MSAEMTPHLQALMTVALALEGDNARGLFDRLPASQRSLIMPRAEKFWQLSETDRRVAANNGLKTLRSEFLLRQITDVHPSHIALVLANESAAIIRTIFHHLPSEMIAEVETFLPEKTVKKLASYPDPPIIADELLEVVKHAFIRQFTFILPGENPLTRVNATRLRSIIREMSFNSIATAMRRIDRQELVDSLQRFPRAAAKEIVRRLKLLRDIEFEEVLTAERCLVWLNAQQLRNFSIMEDTGLMLLAAALLNEKEQLQKFLMQKLSLEESGRFYEIIGRLGQAESAIIDFAGKQLRQALTTILQARQPLIPNLEVATSPAG